LENNSLRSVSGPSVFEEIFQEYCRPGGLLEDFNVTEITAQAAAFRSRLIDQCRADGLKVKEWIKQIPVLP
jgi:hypothetical protein